MERANAHFSISYRKLLTNADITISDISPLTYTGQEQKPTVTVKDGETTLVAGTDYTVSYSDNVNAGTATVTITAVESGNYSGTASATFSITQKVITVHGITAKNKIYDGNKIAELIYDDIVFDGKKEGDKLTVTATREQGENRGTGFLFHITELFLFHHL